MGLLLSHNSTLKVWNDLVVVSTPFSEPPKGGGKRSEIEGFSRESRKRMIEDLHKVKFAEVLFVTLTYPAEFPHDWRVYKRNLKAFRMRVEREFGKVQCFWRLEYQKRGAPHYHLLYLDPPYMGKEWVSLAWYEVVGSGDVRHLKAGTNVVPIREEQGKALVAFYVGKYASKPDEGIDEVDHGKTGRHWGKWNVKTEDPIEFTLESGQAEYVALELFSSRGSADTWRPSDYRNTTIMGDSMGSSNFRSRAIALLASGGKGRI